MFLKSIDYEKCTSCLACVHICTNSRVIGTNEQGKPIYIHDNKCIGCGHCLAICPEQAITFAPLARNDHAGASYFADARPLDTDRALPDAATVQDFLGSTRTSRFFTARPAERDKLALILDSMVRAPSAGNEQNRNFYILTDPAKIAALEAQVKAHYQRSLQIFRNPLVARLISLSSAWKASQANKRHPTGLPADQTSVRAFYRFFLNMFRQELADDSANLSYLRGAPALMIISTNRKKSMHQAFYKGDATIAAVYGTLMARSLGLSACWLGLLEIAVNRDQTLRQALGLGDQERMDAGLALGYSDLVWRQMPPRGPVKVIWR